MRALRRLALVHAVAFCFVVLPACGPGPKDPMKLPLLEHSAYVWQRNWGAPTIDAVKRGDGAFRHFMILAAELPDGGGSGLLFPVAWTELPKNDIWAVIRVRHPGKSFESGDVESLKEALLDVCSKILAASGGKVFGFQIDMDSPTRLLPVYAALVKALRAATPGRQWSVTTLPTWLGQPGFSDLMRSSGEFVLQVHSLELPRKGGIVFPLTHPNDAAKWIRKAGSERIPFTVALPTYFTKVYFDGAGRVADVVSEEGLSSSALQARSVSLGVPPVGGLVSLVRDLERERPPALRGIAWFRLPTARDAWVLPLSTLMEVSGGKPVADAVFRAQAVRGPEGYHKVSITNVGGFGWMLPASVNFVFGVNAAFVAGDGSARCAFEISPSGGRFFRNGIKWVELISPNEEAVLGWFRLAGDSPAVIEGQVSDEP